jgi:glycosyltransferase involved in cell wall biosynthesis
MRDLYHFVVVTQPTASSGLGGYLIEALRQQGAGVDVVDALASKWHKLWPVVQSMRFNREAMWRARWENMLYSPWAWDRNTVRAGKLLDCVRRSDSRVLLIGKEFFPHPNYHDLKYDVLIHNNMRLSLKEGKPWIPPQSHIDDYLERETALYKCAHHLFVGAGYVGRSLIEEYDVDPASVKVVGAGLPPFFEANMISEIPSRFLYSILFVGYDFDYKGGLVLLQALEVVRSVIPQITLTVIGPDADQVAATAGVEVCGMVKDKQQLLSAYRHADLFVMPSLCDSFGFVFLEAMSQGLPCIGTDLNAMPEIIEDGTTGYIVPLRDPESLAAAILRYYGDEGNRARMGQAALERVQDRYTWGLVAERILEGETGA